MRYMLGCSHDNCHVWICKSFNELRKGNEMAKQQVVEGVRRLSDIVQAETVGTIMYKPADVAKRDMILIEFYSDTGEFGEFYVMTLQDPRTNEVKIVRTGYDIIKNQLARIDPNTMLPLVVRFEQVGNTWLIR